jgi:cathepsin B
MAEEVDVVKRVEDEQSILTASRSTLVGKRLFITGATKASALTPAQVREQMGTTIHVRFAPSIDTSNSISSSYRRTDAMQIGPYIVSCNVFEQSESGENMATGSVSLHVPPNRSYVWIVAFVLFSLVMWAWLVRSKRVFIVSFLIFYIFGIVYIHALVFPSPLRVPSAGVAPFPVAFDCRSRWPVTAKPPFDQGTCGNCWAVASADVITDRARVRSSGRSVTWQEVARAMQKTDADACHGASLGRTMQSIGALNPVFGTRQDADVSEWYHLLRRRCGTNDSVDSIAASCVQSAPFMDQGTAVAFLSHNINRIKRALLERGPVVASMICTSTLRSYVNGVWYPIGAADDAWEGGHAVKILGWTRVDVAGELNVDAWIVQNSWGDAFGSSFLLHAQAPEFNGAFRMKLCDGCECAYPPDLIAREKELGGCFLLRMTHSDDIHSPVCSMIEFEAYDVDVRA